MIPSSASDWALLSGLVSAWGLSYLIHSTLLLGAVWVIFRARRLSPGWQDTLWKAALIGGLVTATWQTVGLGNDPLGGRIHLEVAGVETPAPSPGTSFVHDPAPLVSGETFQSLPPVALTTPRGYLLQLANRVRTAAAHGWPQLLLGGWVLGAVLCLARLGVMRVRLGRLIEGRRSVTRGHLPGVLQKLCRAAGRKHPVRLTTTTRLGGPIALVRSEICIPERVLTDLAPEQQENVLAHELAHVVRFDPAWRWICAVMESVFFFQPLNRVARRSLEESSEFLCDDWAVRRTGQNLTLAKCLVEVAGWVRPGSAPIPAAAMADNGSPLVRRVERLLNGASRREISQQWRAVPAFALVCAVVVVSPVVTAGKSKIEERASSFLTAEQLEVPEGVRESELNPEAPDVQNLFFHPILVPEATEVIFFSEEERDPFPTAPPEAKAAPEAAVEARDRVKLHIRKKIQNHRIRRIPRNRARAILVKDELARVRQSMDPVIVHVKQNLPVLLELRDLEELEKRLELALPELKQLLLVLEQAQVIQLEFGFSIQREIEPMVQNWYWAVSPEKLVPREPNQRLLEEHEVLKAYRKALKELKNRSRKSPRTQRINII